MYSTCIFCHTALEANDAIDAYPEYAGTISREILQAGRDLEPAEMNARLAERGLAASMVRSPSGYGGSYLVGSYLIAQRLRPEQATRRFVGCGLPR